MNDRKIIAVRPRKNETLGARFWSAVDALGVRDSDLARRALEIGLEPAAKQLATEQRKQAQETLAKLKGKLSFNSPRNAWSHMVSA